MRKNAFVAMGFVFAVLISGCESVQMKRPVLKPEAIKGCVLVFGKYIEPPYELEIKKLEEEGDKHAIFLNGERVLPFTGSETLKECGKLAGNLEWAITSGQLVYFERGWEGGYRSVSNNHWPEIKAILESNKPDSEKIIAVARQVVGNNLLAQHIVEAYNAER